MEEFDLERLAGDLNPAQWQAVSHDAGPLLVLAGAGSGKTRVLTYRIAYLVGQQGVPPGNILALTFTNKAAREMRRRVDELLGRGADAVWLGTFHGVCLRILRRHRELLPVAGEFAVYDSDDQQRLAQAVLEELDLDPKKFKPNALLHRVSRAKDEGLGPDRIELPPRSPYADVLPEFYRCYQERLRRAAAFDFGDLLLEALNLFRDHPEVAEAYRARFQHVLIDEYQDTNGVQYRLAREIGLGHGNLCAVGDDDQSIYAWRGADIRNILSFEEDFPGTTVIKLEQNYRSTQAILEAAGSVVDRNQGRHPKRLWTEREGGEPVRVHEAASEEQEAAWVADTVLELGGRGCQPRQIAVLYRMHALSRAFEEAFLRRGIPYVVYGGLRFYDRKEVKDVLAYLRLVLRPDDPVAFRRVVNTPPRGIGSVTVNRVEEFAAATGIGLGEALERAVGDGVLGTRAARAVAGFAGLLREWRDQVGLVSLRDILAAIMEQSGYVAALKAEDSDQAEGRLENLEELLNAAESFEQEEGSTVAAFLDRAALVSDQDREAERSQAVTLMTLHSAKGLEYPTVFLAGLEEGVFPHQRSSDSPAELEEERRLLYVGMTRAMDRLYLTRARVRRVYGSEGYVRLPSRFLRELPAGIYQPNRDLMGLAGTAGGWAASAPTAVAAPAEEAADAGRYLVPDPEEAEYRTGMRVRHATYGKGVVAGVEGRGPRAKVTVRFDHSGTRKFLAALANLEVALD